jgi:hypothetical protein
MGPPLDYGVDIGLAAKAVRAANSRTGALTAAASEDLHEGCCAKPSSISWRPNSTLIMTHMAHASLTAG